MDTITLRKQQFIDAQVDSAREQILVDLRRGRIPRSCRSFAELHDYVDANCYGGAELLLYLLGSKEEADVAFDAVDICNAASDILDKEIKDGLLCLPELLAAVAQENRA